MYQIFGVKNMLAWFTTLCGAILLIRVWFLGYQFDGSMADGWKLISSSIAYGTPAGFRGRTDKTVFLPMPRSAD